MCVCVCGGVGGWGVGGAAGMSTAPSVEHTQAGLSRQSFPLSLSVRQRLCVATLPHFVT